MCKQLIFVFSLPVGHNRNKLEVRRWPMTPTRHHYDTDLSDAEWALAASLLPPEKPGVRHRENDLRELINGLSVRAPHGDRRVPCST